MANANTKQTNYSTPMKNYDEGSYEISEAENDALRYHLSKIYAWLSLHLLTLTLAASCTLTTIESTPLSGSGFIALGVIGLIGLALLYFIYEFFSPATLALILLSTFAVTGFFIGPLLFLFEHQSYLLAFLCMAGTFAAMSLYELVAKNRPKALNYFLMMSIFTLIIYVLTLTIAGKSISSMLLYWVPFLLLNGYTAYSTEDIITQSALLSQNYRPKSAIHATADFIFTFILMSSPIWLSILAWTIRMWHHS